MPRYKFSASTTFASMSSADMTFLHIIVVLANQDYLGYLNPKFEELAKGILAENTLSMTMSVWRQTVEQNFTTI